MTTQRRKTRYLWAFPMSGVAMADQTQPWGDGAVGEAVAVATVGVAYTPLWVVE